MNDNIKRGDLFYVAIPSAVGSEMYKTRPAVIVSNNIINKTSPTVMVVYCTSSTQKRDMPEHVVIRSTPVRSIALCEGISCVDKSRIENYIGHITEREMVQIDLALMIGLQLQDRVIVDEDPKRLFEAQLRDDAELIRKSHEADIFHRLYDELRDILAERKKDNEI